MTRTAVTFPTERIVAFDKAVSSLTQTLISQAITTH